MIEPICTHCRHLMSLHDEGGCCSATCECGITTTEVPGVKVGRTAPLPTDPLVEFFDVSNDNEPVASVLNNGTVILYKEGAAPEAARILWDAIQFDGRTLRERAEKAEAALKELVTHYDQALEDAHSGDSWWLKGWIIERFDEDEDLESGPMTRAKKLLE